MNDHLRSLLLTAYSMSVEDAYDALAKGVFALREAGLSSYDFGKELKRISGSCGAACSAATKRLFRAVVLDALEQAKASGLDITPTVAYHVAERILGRGVDQRATLAAFATPGRTATDKSTVEAADLVEIEAAIRLQLEAFAERMAEIKSAHAEAYKAKVRV